MINEELNSQAYSDVLDLQAPRFPTMKPTCDIIASGGRSDRFQEIVKSKSIEVIKST